MIQYLWRTAVSTNPLSTIELRQNNYSKDKSPLRQVILEFVPN